MAAFQLDLKINGVDQSLKSINDLEAGLKASKEELSGLATGSKEFEAAASNIRKIDSALKDVKLQTEGVNTKQLAGSFAKLGETVAGSFAVATNAAELFGLKNTALADAQVKAQQAIAVVLGARAIAEGVVEGRAAARFLVEKASVALSEIQIALTEEQTVATVAQATATEAATTAQLALNLAMKAAPYALVAAALIAVVAALIDTGDETENLEREVKTLDKTLKDLNESYDKTISKSNDLFDAIAKLTDQNGKLNSEYSAYLIELAKGAGLTEAQANEYLNQGVEVLKLNTEIGNLKKQQQDLQTSTAALTGEQANANAQMVTAGSNVNMMAAATTNLVSAQTNQLNTHKLTIEEIKKEITQLELTKEAEGELSDESRVRLESLQVILSSKTKEVEVTDKIRILELQLAAKIKADADENAKKREETQNKLSKLIQKSNLDIAASAQETEFKLREIRAQGIEDVELREKTLLQIQRDRQAAAIENAKVLAQIEAGESFKGNAKAIATAKAQIAKQAREEEKNQKKINDEEDIQAEAEKNKKIAEIDAILKREIGYGDFNLSDRRKKLNLEDFNFYNDLIAKRVANDLASGEITLTQQKSLLDRQLGLQIQGIQNERDLKKEELDFQREEDLKTAEEQLAQGVITKDQYELTISGIKANYRNLNEQADIESSDRVAEARIANALKVQDEENRLRNANFQSASQATKALQGLSDTFFAIKFANTKKASKEEEKAARAQFKINKALAITSTVISTIQGVMNALSERSAIPQPYGTILKAITAVAVGAAGAANVAKIAGQQFEGPFAATADTGNIASATGAATSETPSQSAITQASTGGFTAFSPNAVTPSGGTTVGDTGSTGPTRVYVLESDITNTQKKVTVQEANSTFG